VWGLNGFRLANGGDTPGGWGPAIFTLNENQWGFCHSDHSFRDRITGHYDGSISLNFKPEEILKLWAEAGNTVQWKK